MEVRQRDFGDAGQGQPVARDEHIQYGYGQQNGRSAGQGSGTVRCIGCRVTCAGNSQQKERGGDVKTARKSLTRLRVNPGLVLLEVLTILLFIIFMFPFGMVIINSAKTSKEIIFNDDRVAIKLGATANQHFANFQQSDGRLYGSVHRQHGNNGSLSGRHSIVFLNGSMGPCPQQ